MTRMGFLVGVLAFVGASKVLAQPAELSEQAQYAAFAEQLLQSLDLQRGKIGLANGVATLDVSQDFYYLSPADSETVLVDLWGNPPGAGANTLGMLFPSSMRPFDEGSWGVTIEYEQDGYVSDDNADEIDYGQLLDQMKASTRASSQERLELGYEAIELVGWASSPFYDKDAHKLYWAKEIRFGDQAVNTLNYNIRVLGRKGVLVLNFIASMDQKTMIDASLDAVLAIAEFDQGARYQDFNPDFDDVAAYGLGALVAGKVLAKTGLIAAALIFLKKFGVLIVLGVGAFFKKFLGPKKE